jgi:hypothetical protein
MSNYNVFTKTPHFESHPLLTSGERAGTMDRLEDCYEKNHRCVVVSDHTRIGL